MVAMPPDCPASKVCSPGAEAASSMRAFASSDTGDLSNSSQTSPSHVDLQPPQLSVPCDILGDAAMNGGGGAKFIGLAPSANHGLLCNQAVYLCVDDLCCSLRMQVQTVRQFVHCSTYQAKNLEESPDNMLARLQMVIEGFRRSLSELPHLTPRTSAPGTSKETNGMPADGINAYTPRQEFALDSNDRRLEGFFHRQEQLLLQLLQKDEQKTANDFPTSRNPSKSSRVTKSKRSTGSAGPTKTLEEEEMHRKTIAASISNYETPADERAKISRWRQMVRKFVAAYAFEAFFAVAIATNAIFMGAEVDYKAKHGDHAPLALIVIRHSYNALFFIELVMRAIADGCPGFFCSEGDAWIWNCLDLFLVLSSIVEVVYDIIKMSNDSDESGSISMSNVRAIRMIRLTRLVRIVRITRIVRFVRALRTLVYSIICTLKSLVWSMVLLVIIIYVYAIMFTQAAGDHLHEETTDLTTDDVITLHRYWGSLSRSMFTLFKSIAAGVSWDDVVRPLEFYWLWPALFTVFIAFAYFAVLNVVTGVFCQSAIESAQHDHDMIMAAMSANKSQYAKRAMQLFKDIDADRSGELTIKELEGHLQEPTVREYFMSLEIEPEDAWTLFKLIDVDETNVIDLEEFVMGCLRLKGAARSIDMAKIMYDHKWMMKRMGDILAALPLSKSEGYFMDSDLCSERAFSVTNSVRSPRS